MASSLRQLVLVVERDRGIRDLTRMVLEEEFGVDVVSTGAVDEALRLVQARKPNLVLIGVRGADVGCLEVARRLKADPASTSIPVLALVHWGEGQHEALGAGCDAVLVRPFDDVGRLSAEVRRYLMGKMGNDK